MKKGKKALMSLFLAGVLIFSSVIPVMASSNVMNGVKIWRYQHSITPAQPTPSPTPDTNQVIKVDYDANGVLDGMYFDPNRGGDFSGGKVLNDFSMEIIEGGNTYTSDNVSIISQDGNLLNGYDEYYDFLKRRMSEYYYNGVNSERYITTMYSEFFNTSDIVYLYPRLHFKGAGTPCASPDTLKYKFKFPGTKYNKIYYDVQPQQILQDDSYESQGSNISFKGDNLLNASGSFEKVGGWETSYQEIDYDTVKYPKYVTTSGIPGWKIKNNPTIQQVSGGKYGNYSLQFTNNSTVDYNDQIFAKFDVIKGDTYTISAWVKATSSGTSAKLWIDGYPSYQYTAANLSTTTWTQLYYTFTVPKDPNEPYGIPTLHLSLSLSSSAGKTILVDGVKAELGSSATAYGNNMAGLSSSTVLYNTSTQEGLIIYTPLTYPEKRKWYSDDFVRKAFMDYNITRQIIGNELVLSYEVTGQSMDSSNTVDFYFYVRPFKGSSVINDGISAFKDNIDSIYEFDGAYATVTTLNRHRSYYPIEGYSDQFYNLGFTPLHKGKDTGYAPWYDAASQEDWGVNGESGYNWGFVTNNIGNIGKKIYSYIMRSFDPTQTIKDEIYRYIANYIDKTHDSKANGVYTSGGMPNYKLLHDSLVSEFTLHDQLDAGYNNFYFGQVGVPMMHLLNYIFNKLSLGDKNTVFNEMDNLRNLYDKDGAYSWTYEINHLSNGSFEDSAAVNTGNWETVGSVSVTPSPYTVENTGTNAESGYIKSTFANTAGTDYSSQVSVKSNLAGGAKVWLTTADNPVLIDSTPLNSGINGNLEMGTLSNWSIWNQGAGDTIVLDTNEKHSGSYSIKYTHNSTNSNAVLRNGNTPSSITGKKYKATAWVKSADSNPVNISIDVGGVKKNTYTVGDIWTEISTTIYATTPTFTNIGFIIPQNKAICVDDVVYAETAEDYCLNDDDSNGDVENGSTAGWAIENAGTGDSLEVTSDVGYEGSYALKYIHGSVNNALVRNIANVYSISGKKYKGSAWVMSGDGSPVNVTINISGVGSKTFTVGGTWANIFSIVDTTNEYYNTLNISIPSGKSLYIDGAALGETCESVPLNDNCNGGVESGSLSNWTVVDQGTGDTADVITSDTHSGSYAIKYSRKSSGTTTYIRNSANVGSTAGRRYKATAWVKSANKYPFKATIDVSGAGPREYTVGSTWMQISTTVNTSNQYFNTVVITIPTGKSILVDDVVIMDVTDKVPVYSIDINNTSWSTLKCLANADVANNTTSDLKLYMRPQDQVIVDTRQVQKISGWTAVGNTYTEVSNDYSVGSHSLLFKNMGGDSRENYLNTSFTAGLGSPAECGKKHVSSIKVKAKSGTSAKVWMDMSEIYSSRAFLNGGLNGDMEYGNTDNWEINNKTANDTIQAVTTDKYGGTYGLQYVCNSSNAGLRYSIKESSSPNKSYKLSAWVKAGSGTTDVTISLAGKQQLTYNNISSSWQQIYTIVEKADGSVSYADFRIPSGNDIYIDDVRIEETTDKLPMTTSYNEGVEENCNDHWELVYSGQGDTMQATTEAVHSGSYAMKFIHNYTGGYTSIRNVSGKYAHIGKKYKATAWVKSAGNPILVQIHVNGVGLRDFMVGSEWTQIYTYATAESIYLNNVGIKAPIGSTVYIDDVNLVETDEAGPLTDGCNNGLETGTNSNWQIYNPGSGDSIQVVSSERNMGSYALKYNKNSPDSSYVYNSCSSSSIVGRKYRASAWVKNANSGNVVVTLKISGVGPKNYLVSNTGWTKLTTYADASNGCFNTVALDIPQGNSIYIDDSELTQTMDKTPLNFTLNGDLETGNTQDFSLSYYATGDNIQIDTTEKHSGNYSLKFTAANTGKYRKVILAHKQPSVPSVPGKKYKFSSWVKSATGSNVNVYMHLSGLGLTHFVAGNTWTKLESTIDADSEYYNQVNLLLEDNSSIYVDDVSVEEVYSDEPIIYYNINDNAWTSIIQKQNMSISSVENLKIYTRPGDEILIDAAQTESGPEASQYYLDSGYFFEYSPINLPQEETVINSHIDAVIIASIMKKLAYAAGNNTAASYWEDMSNKGVEGILWFMRRDSAFQGNDLVYSIDKGPNSSYGKYCLAWLDELFNLTDYKKQDIKPYVWKMVNNYMEDNKDDHYGPVYSNFSFEINQILYGIVWNDLEGLRAIESNWPVYYPTVTLDKLRAFRVYCGKSGTPILDDIWYYGFTMNQDETETFGSLQLNSNSYYIENSTDYDRTVTVTFADRDITDSYQLSGISQATEIITNTALTITNHTVTFTVPKRTFRIVKLTY